MTKTIIFLLIELDLWRHNFGSHYVEVLLLALLIYVSKHYLSMRSDKLIFEAKLKCYESVIKKTGAPLDVIPCVVGRNKL